MKRCCGGIRAGLWQGVVLMTLLVWLASGSVQAQGLPQVGLRDDAPERYSVVRGDTLWDIAGRFLHHPWQWPEVWQVNPQIRNPHLIYPGDIVYLHYRNGQPRLGLERGQEVVRLSPEMRRIPRREAIPPLPLEIVQPFLSAHRVIDDPARVEELAYVVAGDDRRIVSGAGDHIYARGDVEKYGRLGLYRLGERYHDRVSGEFLGLELESVGQARWVRREGDIALLEIVSAPEEVRNGDLVMPLEPFTLTAEFQLRAPQRNVDGTILAVPEGVHFIGHLQVVAMDRGRRDGLAPGHVLTVEQRGELVIDPVTKESLRLPGVDAGQIMVFRAYGKMSYGLVMRASRPLAVGDRVYNPESVDRVATTSFMR